jgi:Endosomal/lysosomal potassium channel TMEM175
VTRPMHWLVNARAARGEKRAGHDAVSRDTGRVEAFSDGVFAITTTLLVFEIRPPEDYDRLLHDLVELWPSYLAYAVTFLFIGQVWANHHAAFVSPHPFAAVSSNARSCRHCGDGFS